MSERPDLAALIADPSQVSPEEIPEVLGALERLKGALWARLTTPASVIAHAADEVLEVKDAAPRLGMTVSHLRHEGDRLHAELLAATGEGFIVPWGAGTVRYSAAGLEALKRWLRSQPRAARPPRPRKKAHKKARTRSLASDTPERL